MARPATLAYRLGKLGRKNKLVASLLGTALLVMLGFAVVAIQARVTASSRASWAQHFGQEAERIEALLRYSRLQPTHDVRPELDLVKARIQALEASVHGSRGVAQGPGSYALGRAYLALGDFAKARTLLDQAFASGFKEKSLAYARGRALSQLYSQGLQQARVIQNPELQKARLQELEESLRDPALRLLREGQGSLLDPAPFQEGLLAFHAGHHAEAIAKAREASKQAPWFYEARRLEAEIRMDQAWQAKDSTQALAFLREADLALDDALATAPSDPDLRELESRRWWEELVARRRMGWELEEAGRKMETACARWGRILPGSVDVQARRACWFVESARDGRISDKEARLSRVREGARLAEQVLASKPEQPEALGALAAALRFQAYSAMEQNKDPRLVLDRVIQLLNQAIARSPEAFEFMDQLAMAYAARIEYEKTIGLNPSASLQQAIQAMEQVVTHFPRVADFEAHIANFLVEQADYDANHGIDPNPMVNQALARLQRAVQRLPERFEFHFSIGNAYLTRAWHRMLHGADALPDLEEAQASYARAAALNPKNVSAFLGLAEVGATRAWVLQARGVPFEEALAQVSTNLAQAEALETPGWRNDYYRAEAALVAGKGDRDPRASRAKLLEAEHVLRTMPSTVTLQPQLLWLSAQVQLALAERVSGESRQHRVQAEACLKKALEADARFEPARQTLAASFPNPFKQAALR